ncbi:hypothetical protein JCM5353_007217 [Sporobolomyces roseus]
MPPRPRSSNGPDPTNQRERQWHGTRIRSRTRSRLEQPRTRFYLKLAGPLLLALGPLFGAPTVCVLLCYWIDSRPRRSGCSMSGVGAVIGMMRTDSYGEWLGMEWEYVGGLPRHHSCYSALDD